MRGHIFNREGMPVRGARLIVWQANSFGRYAHSNDSNPAPLDPSFIGFAEILSDRVGAYWFKTVKPGAYPAGPDWMRPPHIHFEVHGHSERLITQMYFAGEALNTTDRILMSASHPDLLIAAALPLTDELGHRAFDFDIVLSRG